MHSLQPCGVLVACGRRLFLQAISPLFLVVSSSTKKHTASGVFFNAFLTHLRDLFLNRAWSLSSALDDFSCKQSLIFACRQQLIKYRLFTTKTSCFFNVCKVFCTHLHNFFEIVRGACRLRSAIANTSCSHRLLLPAAALWSILS